MATVHGLNVTIGWPESAEDDPVWGTIDVTVDGKYVRMQYDAGTLADAAAVQTKLTADAAALLNPAKQKDEPFPVPTEGTDRPDLVPSDFAI